MNTVLPVTKPTTPRPTIGILVVSLAVVAVLLFGAGLWIGSHFTTQPAPVQAAASSIAFGSDRHERHLAEELAAQAAFALQLQRMEERGQIPVPVLPSALELQRREEWTTGSISNPGAALLEQRRGEWLAGKANR